VQSYKNTQQPQIDALNQKNTDLQTRETYFSNLYNKITSLTSTLDTFQSSDAASKFQTRTVTSSNTSVLTATGNADSAIGINSVKVNRLASSDTLVSDKMTSANPSISPGVYNFTINGKDGQVTLGLGDTTEEDVMQKLASAINTTTDANVNASYVKIDNTSAKLTITSKDTGSQADIQFSDSAILTHFGITNAALNPHTAGRTVATDNSAGYQTADYNNLDANLQINGINIYRNSNTISDALTGITLNLFKAQDTSELPITLQTDVNSSAVESLIQPLLDSFNSTLQFLNSSPTVSKSDSSIKSLYNTFRGIASQPLTSAADGDPKTLMDVGIKINTDGTLTIDDHTKLSDLLKTDPNKVAAVFTATDGFANRLSDATASLTGSDGLILERNKSLAKQIDNVNQKTTDLTNKIDAQGEILRKQYQSLLQLLTQAQSQYNFLSSMTTSATTSTTG
jgi:flagellar hook-associated protein 2